MLYWKHRSVLGRHSPLTCLLPSHTLYPSDWVWARWISDSGGGGEQSPCVPASCQCNVWGRSDPTPTWPADKAVSPAEPRHPHWLENQVAEDTVAIDYGAGGGNLTELQGVQTDLLHLNMHPVCAFDETQGRDLNALLMVRNLHNSVDVNPCFNFSWNLL